VLDNNQSDATGFASAGWKSPERLLGGPVISATGGPCNWSPACKFRSSPFGS
jgi:hypothetical protein